ncbi:hypothetical protein [Antarcticirhabdus aurantiaca]|uniref:Uncharacterized protein n=1 Tax=Antarcticirhabdus aurantiaca TaxID=2606717 RepID=A0ACD4NST9_9HYPH|nr:hypothetical protein [Antarcticirhabdus aurantiaca]WAJ30025.1 hypothetical protein OXU80_07380 [Jeongeuplla avenae]
MSEEDEAARRKRRLAAKRFNENVKLAATSVNAAALAIFGTAIILPAVNSAPSGGWGWIAVALGLHFLAHVLLRGLKSED